MRRLKNFLLLFPVQTSLRFNHCGNKQNIALQEFPRLLYSEVAVSATMYFLFSNERHLDSFALFRSNNRKPSGKQNIYSNKYIFLGIPLLFCIFICGCPIIYQCRIKVSICFLFYEILFNQLGFTLFCYSLPSP